MPGMSMPPPVEIVYVCPLDRSIRHIAPGECSRRGRRAELVAEVPEPLEFPVLLTTIPARLQPGEPGRLRFEVRDPWENRIVDGFTVVHESPFHAFVVSEDLDFFLHDHPRREGDGFELGVTLPKPGLYRVLADFLPNAATPQLATRAFFVAGDRPGGRTLERDYRPKLGSNLAVTLTTLPDEPTAGAAATLRFELSPAAGVEPYLGVLGHLFVASDDLIDLMHSHPSTAQLGPVADFSVVFPRPRVYRVWAQFQREGVVNTAHFDVAVGPAP